MCLFERVKALCDAKGTNVSQLCKDITGSTGNMPTWKKGHIRSDYLKEIAKKFEVSTDYLLCLTNSKSTSKELNSQIIQNEREDEMGKKGRFYDKKRVLSILRNCFDGLFNKQITAYDGMVVNYSDPKKNEIISLLDDADGSISMTDIDSIVRLLSMNESERSDTDFPSPHMLRLVVISAGKYKGNTMEFCDMLIKIDEARKESGSAVKKEVI